LDAVLPVFSKKGFKGTTTRELAAAAGISEALLYRHFSSKDVLYEEALDRCGEGSSAAQELERIERMPEGTQKLIAGIRALIELIAVRGERTLPRLMAGSLLEDGRFSRAALEGLEPRIKMLAASLEAARERGDCADSGAGAEGEVWLCQHLALALVFLRMPGKPGIEIEPTPEAAAERAVGFCLRGLGLSEKALRGASGLQV